MILPPESRHPHALSAEAFDALFTRDRPVLFNYHGYAAELQGLLFGRKGGVERMGVAGYREEGSTTTPFDMMLVNGVSRFDLVGRALRAVESAGAAGGVAGEEERVKGLDVKGLLGEVERRVEEVKRFIAEHGKGELISVCFIMGLVGW